MSNWTEIVREHGPMAYATAWRILGHAQDAEDAVQDALMETLRRFQSGSAENWGGWIRTAVTCRAIDRLRRRRASYTTSEEIAGDMEGQPEHAAQVEELRNWLRSTIAELPERQAQVFSMRCFAEMSNTEIARELSLSTQAVGVALHKARKTIAQKHSQQFIDR